MKKAIRITVNGKVYDVVAEILSDDTGASRDTGFDMDSVGAASAPMPLDPLPKRAPPPAAGATAPGAVLSPLAGKVSIIHAPVGSVVAAGDSLITLEAMKMNTIVSSPAGGKVTAVHVSAGEAVEESQLLVTLA